MLSSALLVTIRLTLFCYQMYSLFPSGAFLDTIRCNLLISYTFLEVWALINTIRCSDPMRCTPFTCWFTTWCHQMHSLLLLGVLPYIMRYTILFISIICHSQVHLLKLSDALHILIRTLLLFLKEQAINWTLNIEW